MSDNSQEKILEALQAHYGDSRNEVELRSWATDLVNQVKQLSSKNQILDTFGEETLDALLSENTDFRNKYTAIDYQQETSHNSTIDRHVLISFETDPPKALFSKERDSLHKNVTYSWDTEISDEINLKVYDLVRKCRVYTTELHNGIAVNNDPNAPNENRYLSLGSDARDAIKELQSSLGTNIKTIDIDLGRGNTRTLIFDNSTNELLYLEQSEKWDS